MEIGQDPIYGAEQKEEGAFWKKSFNYFHEHERLGDHPFESDHNENSLTKRLSIQEQCTKFNTTYDIVKKRQVSGLGVGDLVWQDLAQFKTANQNKAIQHCCTAIKDCHKCEELYASWSKNGGA
jgi:hypothetical protein